MTETRLFQARIDAMLTQEQLAERAGVSSDTISLAERGHRPSGLIRQKIARALGVSRYDLWPAADEEISA